MGVEDNNETDNTEGIHIYLLLNVGVHNSSPSTNETRSLTLSMYKRNKNVEVLSHPERNGI